MKEQRFLRRECRWCGRRFYAVRVTRQFCSGRCRLASWRYRHYWIAELKRINHEGRE